MRELSITKLLKQWKSHYNSNVVSINDLIIKEMEGESLSCNQYQAIQNYYSYRIEELTGAVNTQLFNEISYKMRLAANLVPYKEFI